jgi:membrane-bound lytic murein transglycosylase D
MRPADVAQLVGMAEQHLCDVNRIPPRMLVKQGSTLLVPRSDSRHVDVAEHVADNATIMLTPDLPPRKRVVLKAGARESVASVAKRYGVSARQVAEWNSVRVDARFKPGSSVVVYQSTKSRSAASAKLAARKTTGKSTASAKSAKARTTARATNQQVRVAAR